MARVLNVHERRFPASLDEVGALIDTLSSPHDRLWPRDAWPRMVLDRALGVGADGGHGPVRYEIESYAPGRSLWCRFKGPPGFHGGHGFELESHPDGTTTLRHVLRMQTTWPALITWPLVFRWLHDALVEDGLDCAEAVFGRPPRAPRWSPWVRVLRWLVSRGQSKPQSAPGTAALR